MDFNKIQLDLYPRFEEVVVTFTAVTSVSSSTYFVPKIPNQKKRIADYKDSLILSFKLVCLSLDPKFP